MEPYMPRPEIVVLDFLRRQTTRWISGDALTFWGEPEIVFAMATRDMVVKLDAANYAHQLRREFLQWPADWVEAVKERWAPKWFLRCWPVVYKRYDAKVYDMYTGLALGPEGWGKPLRIAFWGEIPSNG